MQHAWPFAAGQPRRAVPCLPAIVLAIIAVSSAGSCARERSPNTPSLPPTPVAALRPTWAVVAGSYLRLHLEPLADAPVAGHLRFADVAEILAIEVGRTRRDGGFREWYLLERGSVTGWAPSPAVHPYGSYGRARDAAIRLRERRR